MAILNPANMLYPEVKKYCDELTNHYNEINAERKLILQKLAAHIIEKTKRNEPVKLIYICTHNSRRSHFGQIWASVAAAYYGVKNVLAFSGGTEATAFHQHAIASLSRIGFRIQSNEQASNPLYQVNFGNTFSINCFSKVFNDEVNPSGNFAAVMTCSDAEENCPFIPGADIRITTTYNDPKAFDNTPQQDAEYDARCRQIALETLYVFSLVN